MLRVELPSVVDDRPMSIFFQMICDLDKEVMNVKENHPYIAAVINGSAIQLFLVAERCVLGHTEDAARVFTALIGAYFAFNIVYPNPIYPLLIFIQRYILGIEDRQPIPTVLVRVLSSLDKVTL